MLLKFHLSSSSVLLKSKDESGKEEKMHDVEVEIEHFKEEKLHDAEAEIDRRLHNA